MLYTVKPKNRKVKPAIERSEWRLDVIEMVSGISSLIIGFKLFKTSLTVVFLEH